MKHNQYRLRAGGARQRATASGAGVAVLLLLAVPLAAQSPGSALENARKLQAAGAAAAARDAYRSAIEELRRSADKKTLAEALASLASLEVSLGAYGEAIQHGTEAAALARPAGALPTQASAANSIGLAHLYLAEYEAAHSSFEEARSLNLAAGNTATAITATNNIGNVEYFRGRYQGALKAYESALELVAGGGNAAWTARARRLTLANLATLYLRLGRNQRALDLYNELRSSTGSFSPSEEARLLLNIGVVYRRMGSPRKALETYRAAQALFRREKHVNGEIGALRNIGIVLASDLGDPGGAREVFREALQAAKSTGNRREISQALLYLGEASLEMNEGERASGEFQGALDEASAIGAVEEKWKALYGLGRCTARPEEARRLFQESIGAIESARSTIRDSPMRTEFLADKRDVYDAAIGAALKNRETTPAEIFGLLEQSRGRSFQDQLGRRVSLDQVRAALPEGTVLLAYWAGRSEAAVVWARRDAAGLWQGVLPRDFGESVSDLVRSASTAGEEWRNASRAVSGVLLAGAAAALAGPAGHVIVVPDGITTAVPFELLYAPGSASPLVEQFTVSYAPSGSVLARDRPREHWRGPWQRRLLAFAAPQFTGEDLPGSSQEVQAIRAALGGRSEIHLGPASRKEAFLASAAIGFDVIHIATHSIADAEDPDRSRIVFAGSGSEESDVLYRREVLGLRLKHVPLVTLASCGSEYGKTIRGEGPATLGQAFLAAGADATVSTLWRVNDAGSRELMKQFYWGLSRGQSRAEALRQAKLALYRAGGELAHPAHWAAFLLMEGSDAPLPRLISWVQLAGAACAGAGAIAIVLLRSRRRFTVRLKREAAARRR